MTCKHCGAEDDHNSDRDKAVQVFLNRYQKSGKKSLHEFAAAELFRQMADAIVKLKPHIGADEFNSYMVVVTKGTIELALEAQTWLQKHTQ